MTNETDSGADQAHPPKEQAAAPDKQTEAADAEEASSRGETRTVVRRQEVAWSGALPPPGALREFDELIPNGAERIMQLTEKETAHRISYEDRALTANIGESRRGQWLGAGISLVALFCGIGAVALGSPYVAVAFLGVPVFSIIQAIVTTRSGQSS